MKADTHACTHARTCLATHCAHSVLFHGKLGPIGQALRVSSMQSVSLPGGGGGGARALQLTFHDPWLNVSIKPPTSTQPVVLPGGTVMYPPCAGWPSTKELLFK